VGVHQFILDMNAFNMFWKLPLSIAVICKKCHWEALLSLRKSFSRHSCAFYAFVIKIIVTKVTVYALWVLFYLVYKTLNNSAYI
jgi:hypothetical protein